MATDSCLWHSQAAAAVCPAGALPATCARVLRPCKVKASHLRDVCCFVDVCRPMNTIVTHSFFKKKSKIVINIAKCS